MKCEIRTFNWRQMDARFSGLVDGSPHGVLEELEEDVVEVRRKVDEAQRILSPVVLDSDFADLK